MMLSNLAASSNTPQSLRGPQSTFLQQYFTAGLLSSTPNSVCLTSFHPFYIDSFRFPKYFATSGNELGPEVSINRMNPVVTADPAAKVGHRNDYGSGGGVGNEVDGIGSEKSGLDGGSQRNQRDGSSVVNENFAQYEQKKAVGKGGRRRRMKGIERLRVAPEGPLGVHDIRIEVLRLRLSNSLSRYTVGDLLSCYAKTLDRSGARGMQWVDAFTAYTSDEPRWGHFFRKGALDIDGNIHDFVVSNLEQLEAAYSRQDRRQDLHTFPLPFRSNLEVPPDIASDYSRSQINPPLHVEKPLIPLTTEGSDIVPPLGHEKHRNLSNEQHKSMPEVASRAKDSREENSSCLLSDANKKRNETDDVEKKGAQGLTISLQENPNDQIKLMKAGKSSKKSSDDIDNPLERMNEGRVIPEQHLEVVTSVEKGVPRLVTEIERKGLTEHKQGLGGSREKCASVSEHGKPSVTDRLDDFNVVADRNNFEGKGKGSRPCELLQAEKGELIAKDQTIEKAGVIQSEGAQPDVATNSDVKSNTVTVSDSTRDRIADKNESEGSRANRNVCRKNVDREGCRMAKDSSKTAVQEEQTYAKSQHSDAQSGKPSEPPPEIEVPYSGDIVQVKPGTSPHHEEGAKVLGKRKGPKDDNLESCHKSKVCRQEDGGKSISEKNPTLPQESNGKELSIPRTSDESDASAPIQSEETKRPFSRLASRKSQDMCMTPSWPCGDGASIPLDKKDSNFRLRKGVYDILSHFEDAPHSDDSMQFSIKCIDRKIVPMTASSEMESVELIHSPMFLSYVVDSVIDGKKDFHSAVDDLARLVKRNGPKFTNSEWCMLPMFSRENKTDPHEIGHYKAVAVRNFGRISNILIKATQNSLTPEASTIDLLSGLRPLEPHLLVIDSLQDPGPLSFQKPITLLKLLLLLKLRCADVGHGTRFRGQSASQSLSPEDALHCLETYYLNSKVYVIGPSQGETLMCGFYTLTHFSRAREKGYLASIAQSASEKHSFSLDDDELERTSGKMKYPIVSCTNLFDDKHVYDMAKAIRLFAKSVVEDWIKR